MLAYKANIGVISLFLLYFEGCGVQIIPYKIVLLTIILFLINYRFIKKVKQKTWGRFFFFVVFTIVFFKLKKVELHLWLILAWISSLFVLARYCYGKQSSFCRDFSKLAQLSTYYSLLHIPVFYLFSFLKVFFYEDISTIFGLFWYNEHAFFLGVPRVQGYAWEPSSWSLMLIINLIFCLYEKRSWKQIIIAVASILFTISTTALAAMVIVVLAYYIVYKKITSRHLILAIIFAIIIIPLVHSNIKEKMNSVSGLARLGDFYVTYAILQRNPIMGGDAYNISQNQLAQEVRELAAMTHEVEHVDNGYYEEEMVNDFAAFLVQWGLILAPIIFYFFYKTPLIEDRRLRLLFFIGFLSVITGCPITRTGIFYLFPLSSILNMRFSSNKKKIQSKLCQKVCYEKTNCDSV